MNISGQDDLARIDGRTGEGHDGKKKAGKFSRPKHDLLNLVRTGHAVHLEGGIRRDRNEPNRREECLLS
jgi:hypothetical protein